MGRCIYEGEEFGELELSAKEAKIAAKLFLKGLIQLGGAGASEKYIDSKAEARVHKEIYALVERVTKDVDCSAPNTFDNCMLKAKEMAAEALEKRESNG